MFLFISIFVSASHLVMLLAIGSQTRAPASGADGGGAGGGGGCSAHDGAPLVRRSGARHIRGNNAVMLKLWKWFQIFLAISASQHYLTIYRVPSGPLTYAFRFHFSRRSPISNLENSEEFFQFGSKSSTCTLAPGQSIQFFICLIYFYICFIVFNLQINS